MERDFKTIFENKQSDNLHLILATTTTTTASSITTSARKYNQKELINLIFNIDILSNN